MRATNRFRADVEGLRAVGVLAVVAYHAGLGAVGGGFVGVDVFYVLGGGVRRLVLAVEAGQGWCAQPTATVRARERPRPVGRALSEPVEQHQRPTGTGSQVPRTAPDGP